MVQFSFILSIVAAICLAACQTVPDEPVALEQALQENLAITLPMGVSEEGLLIIEDVEINGELLQFVVDTGATRSAIFEKSLERLGLNLTADNETMVHGMIESQQRRIVDIPKMTIGPLQFLRKQLILLDNRDSYKKERKTYDGLIGMDVLINYHVLFLPSEGEMKLIPSEKDVYVPNSWARINLTPNPFQDDNRTLHFFQMRIAGDRIPALMDTGSEFSILNWPAAQFSQVRYMRRRLKKDWEMQGAVGIFKPTANIKLERFRGGQKFWENITFIVMDFESLDVLGVHQQSFSIAGMNLFLGDTIFLDFKNNLMAIEREASVAPPDWSTNVSVP